MTVIGSEQETEYRNEATAGVNYAFGGLAEEQHYRTGGKGGLECGMASRTDRGETSAVSQEIFSVREDL